MEAMDLGDLLFFAVFIVLSNLFFIFDDNFVGAGHARENQDFLSTSDNPKSESSHFTIEPISTITRMFS